MSVSIIRKAITRAAIAGGWTPINLPGLYLWYEPSVLGADGSAIASWTDSSGNGNHAINSTSSTQPLVKSIGINGYSAALFGSDFRDVLNFTRTTEARFVALVGTQGGTNNTAPSIAGDVATYDFLRGPNYHLFYNEINKGKIQISGNLMVWNDVYSILNEPFIWTVQTTASTAVSSMTQDRGNPVRGWFGMISEYVVCTSEVNDADRVLFETYAANKYGIILA